MQHAITLKAAALRRHLATAAQLGDLPVLKDIVNNHRATLSRLRRQRYLAFLRLHDAAVLTGLPSPLPDVAVPPTTVSPTSRRPAIPCSPSHPCATSAMRAAAHLQPTDRPSQPLNNNKAPLRSVAPRSGAQSTPPTNRHKSAAGTKPHTEVQVYQVRRAGVYPGRRASPRTRSTLLGRRAASAPHASNGDTSRQSGHSKGDGNASSSQEFMGPGGGVNGSGGGAEAAWSQNLPGASCGRRRYIPFLSLPSSRTLRRLSSAGSMLMRRLSRGSGVEESGQEGNDRECDNVVYTEQGDYPDLNSMASPGAGVLSNTLDKKTMDRLDLYPVEVMNELQAEAMRLQKEEKEVLSQVKSAERTLDHRRDVHDKIVAILDQFYGSLPGWQQDPITQAMFVETVDMTDAGLDTERDLAEARQNLTQAFAALKDHELALSALQSMVQQLEQFISGLDQLVEEMANNEINRSILSQLRQLEKHTKQCHSCAEMASECAVDVSSVQKLERDSRKLNNGFVKQCSKLEACASSQMMTVGGGNDGNEDLFDVDMTTDLYAAKAMMSECKRAEKFITQREKLITEDVDQFEDVVEKCEEYVILERMALVDLHHPSK